MTKYIYNFLKLLFFLNHANQNLTDNASKKNNSTNKFKLF